MLKILCIFTFIGSGLAMFSYLFTFLLFDEMQMMMEDMVEEYPGIEEIFSGGKQFFLTGFILYSVSFAGALQMWKLRKIGFHLYAVAQIFILILPVIMIKSYQLPFIGLLLSSAFVFGYYSNLKYMS